MAILCVLVFLSAVAIDYANAKYLKAVEAGNAHVAALYSLVMYGVGAAGFVLVVDFSLWLMIPEGLGFYIGTLLAVRAPTQSSLHKACRV